MNTANLIAILAPSLNAIQILPQLVKTWTTKSVSNLSLYTILLMIVTNILWLLHGININNNALMISGVTALTINLLLMSLFLIYQNKL
jgi:MtN3 and saliva related transmembrane protein